MPPYNVLPNKDQWKRDIGLATVFGNHKSPFAAMTRIGRLIEDYHTVLGTPQERAVKQIHIMYLLFRQCDFVLKNIGKGTTYAKLKMGGDLTSKQREAVTFLHVFARHELLTFLGCHNHELELQLVETFGQTVNPNSQVEDLKALGKGAIDWFTTDLQRQIYKLSFQKGLAYRWDYAGPGKGTRQLYDTDAAGDALEWKGSLYVMDKRGRIYASGQPMIDLKHSSFMAGDPTQCAGTMRVENGQVVWVSGRSGHYRPTVIQMINLLERLSSYQVDLKKVTVYREHEDNPTPGAPSFMFEGCRAVDLLTRRGWPTTVLPQSMHVPKH